jgi:hypothetical protein
MDFINENEVYEHSSNAKKGLPKCERRINLTMKRMKELTKIYLKQ